MNGDNEIIHIPEANELLFKKQKRNEDAEDNVDEVIYLPNTETIKKTKFELEENDTSVNVIKVGT